MSSSEEVLSNATIREYRDLIRNHDDEFIKKMPKVEMHVHIEGTMTPELRWSLAVRHRMPIPNPRTGKHCRDLSELEGLYDLLGDLEQGGVEGGMLRFFELYYSGFDVLRDEEDFYLLAMNYFQRAAKMNIRYCEPFFDPQGHTRRDVQSQWIMCFLRDMSPESAMSHYIDALPYRDMIVGIGLDSLETDRPPLLFEDVFQRAREDGFKITCHCDVGAKDSLCHIAQVIDQLGGTGADRIDHGLHAADDPSLLSKVKEKGLGMTICPWGYLCYSGETQILERIRIIHDAGVKITIGSDDPAYMEDIWLNNSLYMLRELCRFTDGDLLALQKYAVDICWASTDVKTEILAELQEYQKQAL
ncbi:hypothetical protein BDV33DRAFT_191391 [Aspergillus novoparasiticus]|uniref:Adenosine deaminase domain-containing protein n=1 Tax=Aspergillus novoparasiticus TaxID=986946 RepID=A0A5N6ESB7_9EURO|nr:hypothetical protein BDV33DRAFT_191391 [Aspergillus novoparasiticus]